MKRFTYSTALNRLELDRKTKVNTDIVYDRIPEWAHNKDFFNLFLPYITIIGDSREQDRWIERYLTAYGVSYQEARAGTDVDNLKEGDYTFVVAFGNYSFDFTGKVSYERKGSVSEFYNNCISGREVIKREFERFNDKKYSKTVLMLQFGEKLTDLINMEYEFYKNVDGIPQKQRYNTKKTMYSTVMSWKQPNNNDFEVLQSDDKNTLLWLMLQDMFYYFRNHIRNKCIENGILKQED